MKERLRGSRVYAVIQKADRSHRKQKAVGGQPLPALATFALRRLCLLLHVGVTLYLLWRICRARASTPPHFVFAEPVLSVDLLLEAQPPLPQMMNHEGHAMAMPPEHVVNPQHQQPVGRSASSLILFSILVLTSLGVWVLSRVDQRHIVEFFAALSFESATLAIPLPPPRSTVSVL